MLSYIEISKTNLIHNFNLFKSILSPDTRIVSIVKANAYGHGLKEVVESIENVTDLFGVNSFEELIILRQYSQKPVLILGYVEKENLEKTVKLNATLGVYDLERIQLLNTIGESYDRKVKIHLKIDTFLGRQGVLPYSLAEFLKGIKKLKYINIEAIYSHFANIEDTTDFTHAIRQISTFAHCEEILKQHGFEGVQKHISATSGILVYDQLESTIPKNNNNDYVRLGLGLYGYWPSKELREKHENKNFKLIPVLRWITYVAQVKTLPPQFPIGYGLTYITKQETKIAIIPQGYSDGYDRKLSNNGEVLIKGKRCKVLGRIAMNMFAVDITHLDEVKTEDEVVLIGTQGEDEITADEIAAKINSINYEVISRISTLLPRILI